MDVCPVKFRYFAGQDNNNAVDTVNRRKPYCAAGSLFGIMLFAIEFLIAKQHENSNIHLPA